MRNLQTQNLSVKTIVVGAGLTGLMIAQRLTDGTAVIEKSKGVGGRLATRRSDSARFDHGAQFYTLRPPIQILHDRWIEKSLVSRWFDSEGGPCFNSAGGMTALAKELAGQLDIRFEERVVQISLVQNRWVVRCDSEKEFSADRVVLTAPLPQSLEILRNCHISYDPSLDRLNYAKAVVALIEIKSLGESLTGSSGYRELERGPIFSIADQKSKGVSPTPALAVTLKPASSETLFQFSDADISEMILAELKCLDTSFLAGLTQIKKWRYAHPLDRLDTLYAEPRENLFLAGDAFGGPSLNGAARSANALADLLTTLNSRHAR